MHRGASGTTYGNVNYTYGSDGGNVIGVYSYASKESTDTAGIGYAGQFSCDNDTNTAGYGLQAQSYGSGGTNYGVYGTANNGDTNYAGYFTTSATNSYGVYGRGVEYGGYFLGTDATSSAVYGRVNYGGGGLKYGGYFECDSETGYGVYAKVNGEYTNYAVRGEATGTGSTGAWFSTTSKGYDALYATATSTTGTAYDDSAAGRFDSDGTYGYGVYARADGTNGTGIYARGGISGWAAHFAGNVKITNRSTGATVMELGEGLDYAEGFHVSDLKKPLPGSVLIIDPDNPGKLKLSDTAYDSKVAGIVAGANGLGSGVRLGADRFDNDVALAGRVFCNVDARLAAIKTGDLLTTSDLPGHAMKADDYDRARGAILGKAMEGLEKGQKGKILVLVTLQ